MTKPTAELCLATHVAKMKFADLPSHTIERAKTFIADSLSVGIAGSIVPESIRLLQSLQSSDLGGQVSVWGTRARLSAPNAIIANAFNIHCQEYDCLHEGAVVHAMATLLPVLMAEAASGKNVSGKDLITAVVAGIDIACTLGLAANQAMQFFRPATAGGFGAVAGLASLRKFSPEQIVAAWGFQLAQASGTMQGHREGRPVLPLQISFNARAAWQSCELAQSGLESLDLPLTGECGYLPMFERDYSLDTLLHELGHRWRIDEFSHKPYPSGRATHGGVEGLLKLMHEHQLRPESVASVLVTGPSLINRLVNRPALPNPSPNYARLCMPYVLAKVLLHGEIEPRHYFGSELSDKRTFELSLRIHMATDDNPDPNAFTPVRIEVTLTSGEVLSVNLDHMLASQNRPLTREQCQNKFMRCCALAETASGLAILDANLLFDRLQQLENASNVDALLN